MPNTPLSPVISFDQSYGGMLPSEFIDESSILELYNRGRISSISPGDNAMGPKLSPASSSTVAGDDILSSFILSRPTTPPANDINTVLSPRLEASIANMMNSSSRLMQSGASASATAFGTTSNTTANNMVSGYLKQFSPPVIDVNGINHQNSMSTTPTCSPIVCSPLTQFAPSGTVLSSNGTASNHISSPNMSVANSMSLNQRSVIQISWNKTITSATCVSDITDLMYLYGNQFNAVNIATSLHRLASQFRFDVRRYSEAVRIVLDRARDTNFEGFSPRELANVVWAMAKTEMPYKEDVFYHVTKKAITSFKDSDYTPQAIANLLWGMAKAGYPNAELFHHLSSIAIRTGLRGFNAQNLSNTLWALSTAQLPNPVLFNMIGDFIVAEHHNLKGFSPQNMANAVWAMAKVNMPHIELFNLISLKATESKFLGFKPQEIANLVWAMSMCKLIKQDLITQVFSEIRELSEWKSQEISNLVWSIAIGVDGGDNVGDPSAADYHCNSRRGLSNSNQVYHCNEFMQIVISEIDKRGGFGSANGNWKPSEISNLVFGLHKLSTTGQRDYYETSAASATKKLVSQLVNKFKRDNGFSNDWKLSDLVNIITVVAEMNLIDPDLLMLITNKINDLYLTAGGILGGSGSSESNETEQIFHFDT